MKREQIADIAARYYPLPIKSGKDIIKMDNWCDEFADAIMALPLDVPRDEEIKRQINKTHFKPECSEFIKNNSFAYVKWAIAEIIKRNVK